MLNLKLRRTSACKSPLRSRPLSSAVRPATGRRNCPRSKKMASWFLGTTIIAVIAIAVGVYNWVKLDTSDSSAPVGSGKMFDAIAPRYDITNTILSLGMHVGWREKMIAALNLKPGLALFVCFCVGNFGCY